MCVGVWGIEDSNWVVLGGGHGLNTHVEVSPRQLELRFWSLGQAEGRRCGFGGLVSAGPDRKHMAHRNGKKEESFRRRINEIVG